MGALLSEYIGYIITFVITLSVSYIIWKLDKDQKDTEHKSKMLINEEELKKIKAEYELALLEKDMLKKEKEETQIKLDFLNRIMDFEFINEISESVARMFEKTKADRFLILVAKNGKVDFNIVSVVFEQHKKLEYRINAIARYRNVHIDNDYRQLLKEAEKNGVVRLEVEKMHDSVLRDFYLNEGVKFSKIRFLARKPIDNDNDFLVYSSISTHESKDFTKNELVEIKTQYEGTILRAIEKVFD